MEGDVLPPEKVAEAVRKFVSEAVTLSTLHILGKDSVGAKLTAAEAARLECFYEELDDMLSEVVGADWDEKEAP